MNTGKIDKKEYQKIFKVCKKLQEELESNNKVSIDYINIRKEINEKYPNIKEETIMLVLDDMELKGYIISNCR